jgi:hypothetical protein
MEVEVETSHSKESHTWELGKCIPQATKASRYVIRSARIGEDTQLMKDHAMIGICLGIWPYERDLTRWIKNWWNPKGDYEH